jgi:hypothetical protein
MEFDFQQQVRRLCKTSRREDFLKNLVCVRSLNKVVEWCKSKGITVQLHAASVGQYVPEDKMIFITQRARPEYQLHILLHECGHMLIDKHDSKERFKRGYRGDKDNRVKRTATHRTDVVLEEAEAWERGWRLALRLGALRDDQRLSYDRTRTMNLHTYFSWAVGVEGYDRTT